MGETKKGFMERLFQETNHGSSLSCDFINLIRVSRQDSFNSYSSNKLEFIQRVNIRCQLLKGGYNK